MNHARQLLLAIGISAAFSATGEAQGPGRPTAGIFGGFAVPSGDFKQEVGNGWLAGGLIKMRAYGSLDVRVDGTYVKFGSKDLAVTEATVATDASMIFGTLNVLLNMGPDSAAYPGDNSVSPYLLAGAGSYQLEYDWACEGQCTQFIFPGKRTHLGFNAGFGATVPFLGIRAFAEGRYHRIFRDVGDGGSQSMILISAGVKIR
jgi:hypothetical protein